MEKLPAPYASRSSLIEHGFWRGGAGVEGASCIRDMLARFNRDRSVRTNEGRPSFAETSHRLENRGWEMCVCELHVLCCLSVLYCNAPRSVRRATISTLCSEIGCALRAIMWRVVRSLGGMEDFNSRLRNKVHSCAPLHNVE